MILNPVTARHLSEMRLRGLRPPSMRLRRAVLSSLHKVVGDDLLQATEMTLWRWQESLGGKSANTRYVYPREARAFYAWAWKRDLTETDLSEWIVKTRSVRGLPRPCPEGDFHAAVNAAQDDPRLAAWLWCGGGGGLRAGEIARLRSEEVSRATKRIEVRDGKGGKDRTVLVGDNLLDVLEPFLGRRGRLWTVRPQDVTDAISHHFRSLDLPWTCHNLRHMAATGWLEISGGNIRLVQEQLGHESLDSTQIYTRVAPTAAAQAAAGYDARLGRAA